MLKMLRNICVFFALLFIASSASAQDYWSTWCKQAGGGLGYCVGVGSATYTHSEFFDTTGSSSASESLTDCGRLETGIIVYDWLGDGGEYAFGLNGLRSLCTATGYDSKVTSASRYTQAIRRGGQSTDCVNNIGLITLRTNTAPVLYSNQGGGEQYFNGGTTSCFRTTKTAGGSGYTYFFHGAGPKPYVDVPPTPSGLGATQGSQVGQITATWTAAPGATQYRLEYRQQGAGTWQFVNVVTNSHIMSGVTGGQVYEFRARAESSGGNSEFSSVVLGWAQIVPCGTETLAWGGSNFCAASASGGASGTVLNLLNASAGATGSATATCDNGTWLLSGTTCSVSLIAPASIAATDGTVSNGIDITWAAVDGASDYLLEQRPSGGGAWVTLYAGAATAYSWSGVTAENPFEFRVTASNALGASSSSGVDTGYIRKVIDPHFVSQSVPAKVGVGQPFVAVQEWLNQGSETWVGSAYGTGPFGPANTSIWGVAFISFPAGSTATGESATTTLNLTAPTTPGTYPLQRVFHKDGVAYGDPSQIANIVVQGPPTCSAVQADTAVVYLPADQVVVTISGTADTDAASIRVWSDLNSDDDLQTYSASNKGNGAWEATFPVSNHNQFGIIHIQAVVDNDVSTEAVCATTTVSYPDLPVPTLTLTPIWGSFIDGTTSGYIVGRPEMNFATAVATVPGFPNLNTRIDVLDASGNSVSGTVVDVQSGAEVALSAALSGDAWASLQAGSVRVRYENPSAAGQGKERVVPVAWRLGPEPLNVGVSFDATMPFVTHVDLGQGYTETQFGSFVAFVEQDGVKLLDGLDGGEQQVSPATGRASFSVFNYSSHYDKEFVGVVRATPAPALGITMVQDIVFRSAATPVFLMPPSLVDASDGTFEDEVRIAWPAAIDGVPLLYRVFRDGVEISTVGGVAETAFVDVPPERGKVYQYGVRSALNTRQSADAQTDAGHLPACRAARLVGAWLSADQMTLTGLVERWGCLTTTAATGKIDAAAPESILLLGSAPHMYFSVPLPEGLGDGPHNFRVDLASGGVDLNSARYVDVPFTLNRAAVRINSVTILYRDAPAQENVQSDSIGRFGVEITGGAGVGFAEPVQ